MILIDFNRDNYILLSFPYYSTISNMADVMRTKDRTFIEFNKELLNNIVHIGKLNYTEAQQSLPPHKHHDVLEICYVYRGNPVFYVDDRDYHLKGGDIFLSFPDELHSTGKYPQDRMILYWIGIRIKNIKDNFLQINDPEESKAFLHALQDLKERKFRGSNKLKVIIDDVLELYFSEHRFRLLLIRNRITDFLVSVIIFEDKLSGDRVSELIQNSTEFISKRVCTVITIQDLADNSGLSVSRFKQRFKDEIGLPPGEFILRNKIDKAITTLTGTDQDITKIAYNLEFSSSQYFATVFKRFVNCTPSEYRKKHKS